MTQGCSAPEAGQLFFFQKGEALMSNILKMIAMDLDGTLLDEEKNISQKDREAVREAIFQNLKVGVIFTHFQALYGRFSIVPSLIR